MAKSLTNQTQLYQCCRYCPWSTNSRREHNDPFTSVPLDLIWWCTHDNGPDFIPDEKVIADGCPINKL